MKFAAWVVETSDGLLVGPFTDLKDAGQYVSEDFDAKIRVIMAPDQIYQRIQNVKVVAYAPTAEAPDLDDDADDSECECDNCCGEYDNCSGEYALDEPTKNVR